MLIFSNHNNVEKWLYYTWIFISFLTETVRKILRALAHDIKIIYYKQNNILIICIEVLRDEQSLKDDSQF